MKDQKIVYEEMEQDTNEDIISSKEKKRENKTPMSKFIVFMTLCLIAVVATFYLFEQSGSNVFEIKKATKKEIPVAQIKLVGKEANKQYETFPKTISKLKTFMRAKYVKTVNIIDLKDKPKYEPALQVTFELGNSGLTYEVGNTIGILPKNSKQKVDAIAAKFGYDLEQVITYDDSNKANVQVPYPNGITVREALTEIVDLNCQINDKILASLTKYIKDSKELEEAKKILADEKLIDEFKNKRYNLVDITNVFKSINIPFVELHNIMPFIKPRLYTVASSNNVWKNKFNIVITLVSWKNYEDKEVFGLNSGYLKNMRDTKVYEDTKIIINKGTFKLPDDPKTPIMMICTGSGISPYIAFLEELNFRGKGPYETYLIFGSKTKTSDFLYEKELMDYKAKGILTDVITAFSRDQSYKIYVQDRLKEHFEKKLTDLIINKGMKIFVCGTGAMGKRIKKVILDSIGQENYDKMMENEQFVGEFWG